MKRPSYADLAAELADTKRRASWDSLALSLSMTGSPDAVQLMHDGPDLYTLRAYGTDRADGGVLIVTYRHPGQSETVNAYGLEDWMRDNVVGRVCLEWATAAERLRLKLQERRDKLALIAEAR